MLTCKYFLKVFQADIGLPDDSLPHTVKAPVAKLLLGSISKTVGAAEAADKEEGDVSGCLK
jgi:hypothetical protein